MTDATATYWQFRERLPGNIRIAVRDPNPILHNFPIFEMKVIAMFNEDTGAVAMRLVDVAYRGWTLDMIIDSAARELDVL